MKNIKWFIFLLSTLASYNIALAEAANELLAANGVLKN